ncbi:Putative Hypotehtical protein [Staphylococcus aureus]|nr:Putative Hypotehtical protein [Staphylococcus aureus]CAC9045003.1 Putative Hypotehtical protein [Staphylococcus aureus]CAC9052202.1 Putative Hypotehtical protein [Staphylococcus aureus]CAC9100233.1 Putative Hypotehtical protein [Staphylococcus aureus]
MAFLLLHNYTDFIDIFKTFDVELNITIFLGALVATFIYFISYMNNVNELITLCLTLAFPAYLLKISRSFEVILLEEKIKNSKIKICDKDRIEREILVKKNLIDELLFPNRVIKKYTLTILIYSIGIIILLLLCNMLSYGIGENVNFIWRLLACYVTSVTVIIVALIIMIMIFDLIIGLLLNFQIFLKNKKYDDFL